MKGFSIVNSLRNVWEKIRVYCCFSLPLFGFVPLPLCVPDNAMWHLCSKCLCQPDLGVRVVSTVWSAACCARLPLGSTVVLRSSRDCVLWRRFVWSSGGSCSGLAIWEPQGHSRVYLCSCAKCQILLSVRVLSRQVLKSVFFRKLYLISWRSLWKDQEIQYSHFFSIHLKSVHFMLVGPLTCHQAGLYLKLFVASMCLILVKDEASNAVFQHINQL